MTVSELIRALRDHDPDMKIALLDGDGGMIGDVQTVTTPVIGSAGYGIYSVVVLSAERE